MGSVVVQQQVLKKSLSFVDLVQQIQTILPISNNNNNTNTNNQKQIQQRSLSFLDLSKREKNELNLIKKSNSKSSIEEKNPRKLSGRRLSRTFRKFPEIIVHPPENLTASMPDIATTNILEISYTLQGCNVNENNASCPNLADDTIYFDGFQKFEPISSCSSYASSDEDFDKRDNVARIRRKQESQIKPSVILKNKLKQSVSMHNLLPVTATKYNYDSYHTIHSCTANFDHTTTSKFKSKKEVIYKCCCGMTRCKSVVPIQQYLETYFDNRVSDQNKKN